MRWKKLLPWISWTALSPSEALTLGLSLQHAWEGLAFEWFGAGVIVYCRVQHSGR